MPITFELAPKQQLCVCSFVTAVISILNSFTTLRLYEEIAGDHSVMRDAEPCWAVFVTYPWVLIAWRAKQLHQFSMTKTLHHVNSLWHWTNSPFTPRIWAKTGGLLHTQAFWAYHRASSGLVCSQANTHMHQWWLGIKKKNAWRCVFYEAHSSHLSPALH